MDDPRSTPKATNAKCCPAWTSRSTGPPSSSPKPILDREWRHVPLGIDRAVSSRRACRGGYDPTSFARPPVASSCRSCVSGGERLRWRCRSLPTLHTTGVRDARDDWRRLDVGAIPSKDSTPHLDAFLSDVKTEAPGRLLTLLDGGCGSGRISCDIATQTCGQAAGFHRLCKAALCGL